MLALRRVMVALSLGFVIALGSAGVRPQAAPVTYVLIIDELHDLGTLRGHVSSEARAINENGAIAGSSTSSSGTHRAVFWASPTSSPVNLGHLGGGWSEAWGINDAGIVVGRSGLIGDEQFGAFRWTQAGGMSDLGLVGLSIRGSPTTDAVATDINNSDVIVGSVVDKFGMVGFLYGLGVVLAPSCQAGVLHSIVDAVNDDEFFTGNVWCKDGPPFVPYFASFSATTLLPGQGVASITQGFAINAKNVIAGSTRVDPAAYHAFRWSYTSGYKDIHPPDDTTFNSYARGINDDGLIVGSKRTGGASFAFVYTPGLKMKTLPGLCTWGSLTSQSKAYAVNNSGWVVGTSKTCAGDDHATLWKVRVVVHGSIPGLP